MSNFSLRYRCKEPGCFIGYSRGYRKLTVVYAKPGYLMLGAFGRVVRIPLTRSAAPYIRKSAIDAFIID